MNFVDEEIEVVDTNKKNKNNKKKPIIIASVLIAAIFIVIILIAIISSNIAKMKKNALSLSLDGENNNKLKDMLVIEEGGVTYLPIREIAETFGYKSYNGNYFNKSENDDECYIESKNEIVTFVKDASEIVKVNPSNNDTTYYSIKNPIKMIKDKLYMSMDGIEKTYNLRSTYDEKQNKVILETMNYVVEKNKDQILKKGFKEISTKFDDQKAILNGLAIVMSDSKKYGLYNFEKDQVILETKYDNIEYVPITEDFIVKSNGSVGIKTSEGRDKIQIRYEDIEYIGQDYRLYVVKKDNKYGIIDTTESTVVPIKYDRIGVDLANFTKNNIKNKYVLVNKIIPIMQDRTWALFDTNGTQLTDFNYQSMGCTTNDAENILVVPEQKIIVVCKNKKYILIDDAGKELLNGMEFEQVYLKFQNGTPSYYIVRNGKSYNIVELLKKIYGSGESNSEENDNNNTETDSNKEENSEENNNNNNNSNNNSDSNNSSDRNNNSNANSNNNNSNNNNNNNNSDSNNDNSQTVNRLRNNGQNEEKAEENAEENEEDNNSNEESQDNENTEEDENSEENEESGEEENSENSEENNENDENDENNEEENAENNEDTGG